MRSGSVQAGARAWATAGNSARASATALGQRKVEPDIGGGRRLGQPADRDIGDAGRADRADGVERHAARRFGRDAPRDDGDGLAKLVGGHVVEQQMRRARFERGAT